MAFVGSRWRLRVRISGSIAVAEADAVERMSLEAYLADQYNRDLQDIGAIEQVLVDVAAMFSASLDPLNGYWPYEVKAGATAVTGNASQGTSAMILAVIGKMSGYCTLRDGSIAEKVPDLPTKMPRLPTRAAALAAELEKNRRVISNTFKDNDPLTIKGVDLNFASAQPLPEAAEHRHRRGSKCAVKLLSVHNLNRMEERVGALYAERQNNFTCRLGHKWTIWPPVSARLLFAS
jgi:hypothetical protein